MTGKDSYNIDDGDEDNKEDQKRKDERGEDNKQRF